MAHFFFKKKLSRSIGITLKVDQNQNWQGIGTNEGRYDECNEHNKYILFKIKNIL